MKTSRAPRLNARSLALTVLLQGHAHHAFVQELLDDALTQNDLSSADRRLATHMVYGVLRRRGTLDALLQPFVHRDPREVQPWLWEALRLGAYQLTMLTSIPPHAALYETVELAAQWQEPKAKGFINGILRKVLGLVTGATTDQPAADALPMQEGQYRQLSKAVLPDPRGQPLEYLAQAFSWPRWLAERWLPRFGWDECVRLGFWFIGPAGLWLRVNPLRADRATVLTALHEAGIKAIAGTLDQSIRLHDPVPVRELPGFAAGHFVVQDESAMRAVDVLDPQPGWRVLDLCAAPGGKTTQIATRMANQGEVVACDIDAQRLGQVDELNRRLGLTIVHTRLLGPESPWPQGAFDAVLADVPCSNTGVMGRRPEVRWRLRPSEWPYLVRLQTELLQRACDVVKPGGVVVYSTCSIEPDENESVVREVLRERPAFTLETEATSQPGRPADGAYYARLRRRQV